MPTYTRPTTSSPPPSPAAFSFPSSASYDLQQPSCRGSSQRVSPTPPPPHQPCPPHLTTASLPPAHRRAISCCHLLLGSPSWAVAAFTLYASLAHQMIMANVLCRVERHPSGCGHPRLLQDPIDPKHRQRRKDVPRPYDSDTERPQCHRYESRNGHHHSPSRASSLANRYRAQLPRRL